LAWGLSVGTLLAMTPAIAGGPPGPGDSPPVPTRPTTMRVGAAQPRSRLIDWRTRNSADVLAGVDRSLEDLEALVHKAGVAGCDVLALPEDTLGLGHWEAANRQTLDDVLPEAIRRMLDRLGRAAAAHRMYLVCCNDTIGSDG